MPRAFEDYATAYADVRMERRDGILELFLTTDGGPLIWAARPHRELADCFADVAADRDNRVVILSGTGDAFCADYRPETFMEDRVWSRSMSHGRRLYLNLLDIEVPVIGVVNGPCLYHSGLAVLNDIVLAADDATFQDPAHFASGVVPGDGVHVIWPELLGDNRGRYFLLTNQTLSAREALDLGVVNEIHPREALHDRARELAADLASRSPAALRYTRLLFAQRWRRRFLDDLPLGLAVEGIALGAPDEITRPER